MELLVVGEGMRTTGIKSFQSGIRRDWKRYFLLPSNADESRTKVLGVIWGLQPVSMTLWSTRTELRDSVLGKRRVFCTNTIFGGDGWLNKVRACVVLLQIMNTREVAALIGREDGLSWYRNF